MSKLTFKMLQDASSRIASQGYRYPELVVGPKSYTKLQAILKIDPDFKPWTETGIWWKAHLLGV